jgi:hypothetical protein
MIRAVLTNNRLLLKIQQLALDFCARELLMAKALSVLAIVTAIYAVTATFSFAGAVASGLPAGIWTSVIIGFVWFTCAALTVAALLLMLGNRFAGVVFKPSSFALAFIGCVLTIEWFRVGDNLILMWWMLVLPTLPALVCAAGSLVVKTHTGI